MNESTKKTDVAEKLLPDNNNEDLKLTAIELA